MRNLLIILVLLILTTGYAQNKQIHKELHFGMTQKEIKKMLKKDRVSYKQINFGGFDFILHQQGCVYDSEGKLIQLSVNLTEGGMFGVDMDKALKVYDTMNEALVDEGYMEREGYIVTANNLINTYYSKEKNKILYVGLTPLSAKAAYIYVMITEYKEQ